MWETFVETGIVLQRREGGRPSVDNEDVELMRDSFTCSP